MGLRSTSKGKNGNNNENAQASNQQRKEADERKRAFSVQPLATLVVFCVENGVGVVEVIVSLLFFHVEREGGRWVSAKRRKV